MADTPHSPPPTLIEDVRRVLRLHHYSIHTERSYVEWIRRFVRFHRMQSRADLLPAEPKIEAFLTDLAMQGKVAAATQNQAMNALVFLYKRVLNHALEDRPPAPCTSAFSLASGTQCARRHHGLTRSGAGRRQCAASPPGYSRGVVLRRGRR